jgi:exodeoxyribonuclease III
VCSYQRQHSKGRQGRVKIASWNVNSIRPRLEQVTAWCKTAAPDVLLLQEIKCVGESFPTESFEELGYSVAVYGQKTYNGVAILSKCGIEDVIKGLPTLSDDPQARYIEGIVGGRVRVASVYVPNGESISSDKFIYKKQYYSALREHLLKVLSFEEISVIGGDFNVAAYETDQGRVCSPDHILISPPERSSLRRILYDGWVDSFRMLHPYERAYSWWDYRAQSLERNEGFRIDYVLVSPQASDMLKQSGIDTTPRHNPQPSDHIPIWIEI